MLIGKTRAEAELADVKSRLEAKVNSLEAENEAHKARERVLGDDLGSLHRYLGHRGYYTSAYLPSYRYYSPSYYIPPPAPLVRTTR